MPNQPLEALKRLTGPVPDPSQQILPQEPSPIPDQGMGQEMLMGPPPEMGIQGALAGPPDQSVEAGRQILTKALTALMGILGPPQGIGGDDPNLAMPMGPGGPVGM